MIYKNYEVKEDGKGIIKYIGYCYGIGFPVWVYCMVTKNIKLLLYFVPVYILLCVLLPRYTFMQKKSGN